ncbi:hypothetical protein COY62_00285 [bacterium (Candidatus Howlettbacteria) CG_4_10_14_0_8_um_filter_40_9]|nr:MAG: hypothetical protein COY62_00285 [bacterium (Candidatus Howlettbacteria) CG_4_10_14_0_8_um_filter_40_9]
MKLALYRKYRPGNFKDLLGQDHVSTTLKNAVKGKSFSHAYLFTGPRGVGKTTVARILAKAINCKKHKDGDPCDACVSCKSISEGREIDTIEIDAASNRGIDEIRDLREKVKFTPTNLDYKVFIIDEVHMLTKEAFNALLKTLEEPPSHAVFVLATTEIHKVPQTIISRCQRFDFKRINIKDLVKQLQYIAKEENIDIADEALNVIAEASEGGFRDAISSLDQISSFKNKITVDDVRDILGMTDYKTLEELVLHIESGDAKSAIVLINHLAENGYDMGQFSKNLVEFLRKLLLIKVINTENAELAKEHVLKMKELSQVISNEKILELIELILKFNNLFRGTSLPQLPLELAVVKVTEADTPVIDREANERPDQSSRVIPAEAGIQTDSINGLDSRFHENDRNGKEDPGTSPDEIDASEDTLEIKGKDEKWDDSGQARMTSELSSAQISVAEKSSAKISSPDNPVSIEGEEGQLWAEFLMEIKAKNPSLHAFVRVTEPVFGKEEIVMSFPYRFHKERVEDFKNKKVVEEILEMVYNKPYKLKCILKQGSEAKKEDVEKNEDIKAIDTALDIFGGEIVE